MDYEKKYKEALEIMEKYLKSCNAGVIAENTIKEAFPELKESKDEKIRKSIWQVLSRGESTRVLNALGIQLSEAFDWLEKQKNTTSVTSIHEAYESGFNNGINTVVQEPEEYGLLKEQKSACSEEDEKIRKELIEFLCELSKLGKNTNFDRWSKADCANWLAWLEKQCEQKPSEWSVFDAKKGDILSVDNCVLIVDSVGTFEEKPIIESWYCADSNKFYGKGTSMPDRWNIEGMKPSSPIEKNYLFKMMKEAGYEWDADKKELNNIEQKPAEWSEEDKLSEIAERNRQPYQTSQRHD